MTDKPKRKNHYRRWYAFRGLILVLIAFMGAVGYFITREPEGEYIIYQVRDLSYVGDGGDIKRVNIHTLEAENLTALESQNFSIDDFVVSGNGRVLVYLENEQDFGMRAYISSISRGEREFLFDCVEWNGICDLETLDFDGSKLTFRVDTGQITWYEVDTQTREKRMLAQSNHPCTRAAQYYLICGDYSSDEYHIINYETGETTILDGISNLIFSDDTRQYAYTMPPANPPEYIEFESLSLPDYRDIYAGEWMHETHLLDTQRIRGWDWHPDSKRLLVSVYTEAYNSDGGYEFILYNIETGEQTSLLYMRGTHLSQAQWNRTGTHIVYILSPMYGLDPELDTRVYVYELASGETSLIGGNGMFPHWAN